MYVGGGILKEAQTLVTLLRTLYMIQTDTAKACTAWGSVYIHLPAAQVELGEGGGGGGTLENILIS
jgi:hypothetical protein